MTVLSDIGRKIAARHFIRKVFVGMNQTANLDTTEVKLLVDGVDAGLDAAASSINQAIDASVRTKATTEQKALAVAFVALRRAGVI